MTYLKNCWYVAAWSEEVGAGDILARTLLDQAIVFFRDEDDRLVALADRCPHRFVPLSSGSLKGGTISANITDCSSTGPDDASIIRMGPA